MIDQCNLSGLEQFFGKDIFMGNGQHASLNTDGILAYIQISAVVVIQAFNACVGGFIAVLILFAVVIIQAFNACVGGLIAVLTLFAVVVNQAFNACVCGLIAVLSRFTGGTITRTRQGLEPLFLWITFPSHRYRPALCTAPDAVIALASSI